ncbi:MAG TPA: SDR family NAD(P)-dependent oxidoreductase [Nocardioides sp.]|nr:SDR family NAD(P)-dependent oxidoreductase [Nocardioides sp.]
MAAPGSGWPSPSTCSAGHKVVLLDRNVEALDAQVERLREGTDQVTGVGCDVSDSGSVGAAFDAVHARHGRLDGLVNSAGVAVMNHSGRIEDVSDQAWATALAVNLTGTFLCCRMAVPLMEASGGGSIVNVASTAALVAEPGLEAYTAAKGGVVALTRSLAVSCAQRQVRVNAVCPGLIRTPMLHQVDQAFWDQMKAATPLEVPGPEGIVGLVAYLLDESSSYMTGSALVIDGGFSAH